VGNNQDKKDDDDLILPVIPELGGPMPRATVTTDVTNDLLLDPTAGFEAIDELDEFEDHAGAGTAETTMRPEAMLDLQRAIDAGVSMATTLIEALPPGAVANLEIEGEPPHRINKSVTILGRSEKHCDVVLHNDEEVSRQHAAVIFSRGRFFLEDLESANGTYLGKRRVRRAGLKSDDQFRIGRRLLRVRYQP